jgi:hypothetical protein
MDVDRAALSLKREERGEARLESNRERKRIHAEAMREVRRADARARIIRALEARRAPDSDYRTRRLRTYKLPSWVRTRPAGRFRRFARFTPSRRTFRRGYARNPFRRAYMAGRVFRRMRYRHNRFSRRNYQRRGYWY